MKDAKVYLLTSASEKSVFRSIRYVSLKRLPVFGSPFDPFENGGFRSRSLPRNTG